MEKETKRCPICGETIDAHVPICPICGEATGFQPVPPVAETTEHVENVENSEDMVAEQPVQETPTIPPVVPPVEETVAAPVQEVVPPPIQKPEPPAIPPVEETVAVPPPVPPKATTPPPPPVPPAPVMEEKKQSSWLWVALTLLFLAIIGAGIYFLFFNDTKSNTQESVPMVSNAEKSVAEVLDSIEKVLPPGTKTVLSVKSGDAPCLFFLTNGHFNRFDAKEKQTIEVELAKLNPEATIDFQEGGIIEATPTPDDKDILLLVTSKVGEKGLYKYNVESSRIDILGKGDIEKGGSGYIIRGINNERQIDNTGNIISEIDPGLPEEFLQNEQEKEQPAKPKPQVKNQPKKTEPEPTTPSEPEPSTESQGTGFHFEPI